MTTTADSGDASGIGKDARGVRPLRILSMTGAALVLNLLALWIGSTAGASLVTAAPEPITAPVVTAMTVAPLLLAGAAVWLLARRFPLQRFASWAGLIFALVTSAGSFIASADALTAFTLAAMHVITGLAWFIAIRP